MAKKLDSSGVSTHKVKLMKRGKKKKLILKKVLDYLLSDDYMFAPLVSSQSLDVSSTSSAGIEKSEPLMGGMNKKLVEKLKDYLKSDYHMYAPLADYQPYQNAATGNTSPPGPLYCSEKVDESRWKESVKNVREETRDPWQKTKTVSIEDLHLPGYEPRTTMIRHTVVQKETVKHVVQQNSHSASARG